MLKSLNKSRFRFRRSNLYITKNKSMDDSERAKKPIWWMTEKASLEIRIPSNCSKKIPLDSWPMCVRIWTLLMRKAAKNTTIASQSSGLRRGPMSRAIFFRSGFSPIIFLIRVTVALLHSSYCPRVRGRRSDKNSSSLRLSLSIFYYNLS